MSTTVVPPNMSGLSFVKQQKAEAKKDTFEKGDVDLHLMATSPGWKDLKVYIENLKKSYKPIADFESKSDDEMYKSYGMKMILYDLLSDAVDKIINRVEDAEKEIGKG